VKKTLTRLHVLLVIVAAIVAWRASGAAARAEAAAQPLFVPVIATPSIQPVNGQVLLFKATNITEAPVNLSLMLFDDHGGPPKATRDFPQIPAGSTVSYVHEPQKGELTLHAGSSRTRGADGYGTARPRCRRSSTPLVFLTESQPLRPPAAASGTPWRRQQGLKTM
jgi:hypothetical protein